MIMSQKKDSSALVKKIYIIENLDCANCAAAVERRLNAMPEVTEAVLTFATKQLRITAEDPDNLLDKIRAEASAVEPGVEIYPRTCSRKNKTTSAHSAEASHEHEHTHEHHHESSCGCSHEHDHEQENHDSSCGCGHDHSHAHHHREKASRLSAENKKDLVQILIGAALFISGIILNAVSLVIPADVILLIGYLLLGGRIILTAGKNLTRGKVFDENFLMSLATIAAICIGDFKEAVGVMLFYRVGELFEEIAVERSRSQIMDAVDMRPEVVTKVHGSHTHVIPAEDAEIGDILQIRPGDRIPLDGTVVEGESRIDTSPVTGEPVPVTVKAGDSVVSGCINTSGLLKMKVEKALDESMVTKILDSVENAAASKPQIERFIARFARVYTPVVVLLAVLTAIVPSLVTGDWNHWIYTAITFLVISCPCALVLSVPLAFFSGIGAGSKRGILFKGGISLEAMKNVRSVVMDKTGTITQGNFKLQEAVPANGTDADTLLALCASCEQNSTHPIAQSILAAARDKQISLDTPSEVEEIAGHGIRAALPQGEVLCGNRKLMDQFHVPVNAAALNYGTEVFAALNGTFIGHLVIADTIKPEAADAISAIRSKDIVTAMLTGDAQENADAVAKATGIDEVHARLLPQDKLETLKEIRAAHGAVMFVGDGINDAPVLAGADVGAAMGSGADAAIEAADVVFMTSQLDAVPKALEIAHTSLRIARQNVVFALVIKALVMVLGLAGFANMWMAVFADTGVAMICVLNSIRILYRKKL
ncbi:MAG: cadmium-translocating P-type ATPase [Lachnospiraceae bacterium]|nr:cadmium-translocating P-type ATPase [Lachnospiraceae bacterium]